MSYKYAARKPMEKTVKQPETEASGPSLEALRSGAAKPTAEQMGHRVDLPDAMREKMESAFGADLSAVKLYESETVAEAGAGAMAQGSSIAFAPGMLDFSSFGGQALLGHEISHVVSQARGEVSGGGFLNDAALEARADREGAMAAAGQSVALPASSLSPVSAAGAAGPMQADKTERYHRREMNAYDQYVRTQDPKKLAEYEKYRDKKAARMQGSGADQAAIDASNAETTGGHDQLERARRKFFDKKSNKADHAGFLGDIQLIMNSMSDDQLRADEGFRSGAMHAYIDAFRSGMGQNGYGAFLSQDTPEGGDLMGNMYTRMMGADKIQKTLRGQNIYDRGSYFQGFDMNGKPDQNVASRRMWRLADESGVLGMVRQQHNLTFGVSGAADDSRTAAGQMDTMRGLWNHAVMGGAGEEGSQTRDTASQIRDTLAGVGNTQMERFRQGGAVPRTGKPMEGLSAAWWLNSITPAYSGTPETWALTEEDREEMRRKEEELQRARQMREERERQAREEHEQQVAALASLNSPLGAAMSRKDGKSKKRHGTGLVNAPLSEQVQTYHDDSAPSTSEQVAEFLAADEPKKKHHRHHHHHHH